MMTTRPSRPASSAPAKVPGSGVAPARDAAWRAARKALAEVAARANDVSIEDGADAPGDRDAVVAELRDLVERTLEQLRVLDVQAGEPPEDQPHHPVQDLCFAGFIELKQSLRELTACATNDERAVAMESARRNLHRISHAVLSVSADPNDPIDLTLSKASLESSFAVRRLYAAFRRSLRRPANESPEAVLEAVRYAVGALAALVSSPAYRDVRAQDRFVLRSLRERALAWARKDRTSKEGLRLLGDVWTCADLLQGINRRQELHNHDQELLRALVADPSGDAGWWARLPRLEGFDDELDAILSRSQETHGGTRDKAVLDAVVARLTALFTVDRDQSRSPSGFR
jgi:hypothetical protein